MAGKLTALALGTSFGILLCWSGMTSPDVIRGALLFQQSYLFLFMGSAVGTATLGLALVRRKERRAVFTGVPVRWSAESPERRHFTGSLLFGIGWGISNVCPGPAASQLGQGIGWSLFTLTGIFGGVWLYQRREAVETEPASDEVPATAPPAPSRVPVTVGA